MTTTKQPTPTKNSTYDWNTNNKDGQATHSANDETVTYFAVAPQAATLDDVATAFLKGYDNNDVEGPVTFYVEELATEEGANFTGQPNEEAERA